MTEIKNAPNKMSVKEVCDIIFSLEEKYDLNNMKIQGIYPWQLVRVYVYYEISRKIGIFGSPQQGKVTLKDKILSFLPFIKNSIISNPLSGDYHKDILIFDHPRKVIHNGKYEDIYSYFLIDDINNNLINSDNSVNSTNNSNSNRNTFEIIENPYLNKHYKNKEDYIKYNDRILLGSYINKKLTNIKFKKCEMDKISNIRRELISNFNIEIDLYNIMKSHILDFKYYYKRYDKLFKKRTPKCIFVVVAYENQSIIAAAKDNGVEVIELQHGTISNYHLGYNYPNPKDKNLKYFPDKILSFGEYWKNVANYPINKENIINFGFPHLDENIKSYINNEKNKNQILFISQGVIGKYLSDFASELAKQLKNSKEYEIIYKLHPGEYSNWENNYENLKKANKFSNFTVIDNSKDSLYELLSKSEYQIGVFSTAIYEGLLFNCKTFLVDLPGVEYMDNLIDKNYVKKIKNIEEFINSIQKFEINEYNRDFFFKEYDKSILNKIIDNINN